MGAVHEAPHEIKPRHVARRHYPCWAYLVAVVSNAVLRCGWAVYVSPNQTVVAQHTILLLACAELLRRFGWALLRVEWREVQQPGKQPSPSRPRGSPKKLLPAGSAEANAQANAHTWTPGMLKDMVAEHGGLPLKGLLGSTETGGVVALQRHNRKRGREQCCRPRPPRIRPSELLLCFWCFSFSFFRRLALLCRATSPPEASRVKALRSLALAPG